MPIRLTLTTLAKYSRLWGPPLWATRSAQPMPAQQTEIRRPPSAAAARSTAAADRLGVGDVGGDEVGADLRRQRLAASRR